MLFVFFFLLLMSFFAVRDNDVLLRDGVFIVFARVDIFLVVFVAFDVVGLFLVSVCSGFNISFMFFVAVASTLDGIADFLVFNSLTVDVLNDIDDVFLML